jgi:L-fuconolactonase
MQIDAHQHFWSLARGDYGWLTPAQGAIYRDYAPADLEPHLRRHGIGATILVQAAATMNETDDLLAIAAKTSFVAGVVGWVDFASPDAARVIARLCENPLLVGLRPMVQDIPDDDWLLRPELAPAFQAMIAHGLVFDALVLPRHLSRLKMLLERFPALAVVVDHAAKPQIRERLLDPWRADLKAIAAHPRACCKLSGLATEARSGWRTGDLAPYVEHVLASFGPERVLWGSDWPVLERNGTYDGWRAATGELLACLRDIDRDAILGGNAMRVYLARPKGRPR